MKWFTIVLSVISAIVVLLAIVFEGKLKKSSEKKPTFKSFIREIGLVNLFGWILIGLMLLLNFGNSIISHQDKVVQEEQFIQDTIKYARIINQLREQKEIDSLQIIGLKDEVINNGLKSDTIRKQVVDNAIKALDEQRMLLEQKKENAFLQMKGEVEDNLRKIYLNYEEGHIRGFLDTTLFVTTRLKNLKLRDYIDISSNWLTIEYLTETAEIIDIVNSYADDVSKSKDELRLLNTNMFLANVKFAKNLLMGVFNRSYTINSYKQFESYNFSEKIPPISDSLMYRYFYLEYSDKMQRVKFEE